MAFVLGSCTMEVPVSEGDDVSVKLTAFIDSSMESATRASGDGCMENLAGTDYCLRFNMELWNEQGTYLEYRAPVQYSKFDDISLVYDLNLVAKKYKLLLWADIVEMETSENAGETYKSFYNVEEGLSSIVFPDGAFFGSDVYDAFMAVSDLDMSSGGSVISVRLKRPFAKIRVVDDKIAVEPAVPYTTTLNFDNYGGVSVPCGFNMLSGEVDYKDAKLQSSLPCESSFEEGTGLCLFSGYVFVPEIAEGEENIKYSFSIDVADGENHPVTSLAVADVTLRRNALTTVKGKIIVE